MSRARVAEIGAGEGVRDDVDAKAEAGHLVDRQADAVECCRALGRDKRHQDRGRLEREPHRLGLGPPLDDPSDPVDMPQDEVPTHLVAEPQGAFEVDGRALPPLTDGRASKGFGRNLCRKRARLDGDDAEACARAGDRSADRDRGRVERGGDGHFEYLAAAQPPDMPEIGDDAGKHVV